MGGWREYSGREGPSKAIFRLTADGAMLLCCANLVSYFTSDVTPAMLREYVPVLMLFAVSLFTALAMVVGSHLVSWRRPTPVKGEPYESGIPPVGDTRERFAVKYYVVAMLFLLFDVEVVFLFTWAAVARRVGLMGYAGIMVFLVLLIVGLVYEWKRGALEWD